LGNTSFSYSGDFGGFNISLFVFDLELSKKGSSLVSSYFKGSILLLKIDLKLIDTTGGFSKLFETIVNVLLFNINCLEFLNVHILVHGNEGEVRLRSNINVTTHLLEVDLANFVDHLMNFTHMDNEGFLNIFLVINLEFLEEFL